MMVPFIKADASTIAKPTGVTIYSEQAKTNEYFFIWDYDFDMYENLENGDGGYEIQFLTTKNKVIKKYDSAKNIAVSMISAGDESAFSIKMNNSKIRSNAFKMKIRAYRKKSSGKKIYSKWVTKLFIPQAKVKKVEVGYVGSPTISWSKVAGAKSYTVYYRNKIKNTWVKAGTTKKTSFTISKPKLYQDYLVYVQANGVKVGKKKYSSTKPFNKDESSFEFHHYAKHRYED